MVRLDGGPADLQREHPGGVRELGREVDLEVPKDLAALGTPALDHREVGLVDRLAALKKDLVERLVVPGGERRCRHRGSSACPSVIYPSDEKKCMMIFTHEL